MSVMTSKLTGTICSTPCSGPNKSKDPTLHTIFVENPLMIGKSYVESKFMSQHYHEFSIICKGWNRIIYIVYVHITIRIQVHQQRHTLNKQKTFHALSGWWILPIADIQPNYKFSPHTEKLYSKNTYYASKDEMWGVFCEWKIQSVLTW